MTIYALPLRYFTIVLFAGLAGACAQPTGDSWPEVRHGRWAIHETRDGQTADSTECSNPVEKLRQSVAQLDQSGCKRTPVKRSGGSFEFSVECERSDEAGNPATLYGTFKLSTGGPDSLRMETSRKIAGDMQQTVVEAKRLGECESESESEPGPSPTPNAATGPKTGAGQAR